MIVVNPFPRNDPNREWGGWQELFTLLAGNVIVLVGTEDQRKRCELLVNDNFVANCCGDYRVKDLAGMMQVSNLVITVNTMPMHLASALNIPCVAIVDQKSSEIVKHPNITQVVMPCTAEEVFRHVDKTLHSRSDQ